MTTRGYCNEMYYGKKLSVKDILSSTTRSNDNGKTCKQRGKARMLRQNRDYETLVQMLNDYCVDENLDNNNYLPPAPMNGKQQNHKKQNGKKELYPHEYHKYKNGAVEIEQKQESEDENEEELGTNVDNQGDSGNANIWNNKVY